MFSIQLSRIPKQGLLAEEKQLPPEDLGLNPAFGTAPVRISYELRLAGRNVLAKSRAFARAFLECGRCLKHFEVSVETSFLVEFEPEEAGGRPGEIATAEELQRYSVVLFQGEEIPLGEEFRQELELELPHNPLCLPDCLGLCSRCGADLNLGPCFCPPRKAAVPFSALKDYWTELKEKKHG
jgi:uncharacterized protein